MRHITRVIFYLMRISPVLLPLFLPVAAPAQYKYTTSKGTISITGYDCSENVLTITNELRGLPVVCIERSAFLGCTNLCSVTIPDSILKVRGCSFMNCGMTNVIVGSGVANFGRGAFYNCTRLTGIYFFGNAPERVGDEVFFGATNATVYYLPGRTGWGKTFGGRPTAIWTGKSP